MARPKSPSGSKASRPGNENKEQTGVNASPSAPEVKATAAETAVPEVASREVARREVAPPAEVSSKPQIKPEPKKPEPKKMEVVKTEARKNVVPINVEDEIRRRAYELYQQRGKGSGSEAADWFAAEQEVRQRYHQQSASA
jgi:hypothetical protein